MKACHKTEIILKQLTVVPIITGAHLKRVKETEKQ